MFSWTWDCDIVNTQHLAFVKFSSSRFKSSNSTYIYVHACLFWVCQSVRHTVGWLHLDITIHDCWTWQQVSNTVVILQFWVNLWCCQGTDSWTVTKSSLHYHIMKESGNTSAQPECWASRVVCSSCGWGRGWSDWRDPQNPWRMTLFPSQGIISLVPLIIC